MDDETVRKAGTERSRAALKRAYNSMLEMLAAWEAQTKRVREDERVNKTDMGGMLRSMAQARTTLTTEIHRNEKEILENEGRIDTAPIDFDALRNEVGRRLARLRAVDEAD